MFTTIKVYACYAVKIYKKNTKKYFQTGGRAPGAAVLDPPLICVSLGMTLHETFVNPPLPRLHYHYFLVI